MNKISFAILCNYVQSVATTFCLLLFPSISSYNNLMVAFRAKALERGRGRGSLETIAAGNPFDLWCWPFHRCWQGQEKEKGCEQHRDHHPIHMRHSTPPQPPSPIRVLFTGQWHCRSFCCCRLSPRLRWSPYLY